MIRDLHHLICPPWIILATTILECCRRSSPLLLVSQYCSRNASKICDSFEQDRDILAWRRCIRWSDPSHTNSRPLKIHVRQKDQPPAGPVSVGPHFVFVIGPASDIESCGDKLLAQAAASDVAATQTNVALFWILDRLVLLFLRDGEDIIIDRIFPFLFLSLLSLKQYLSLKLARFTKFPYNPLCFVWFSSCDLSYTSLRQHPYACLLSQAFASTIPSASFHRLLYFPFPLVDCWLVRCDALLSSRSRHRIASRNRISERRTFTTAKY